MSTFAEVVAAAPSFRGPAWKERPRSRIMTGQPATAQIVYWVKLSELEDALDVIDGVDTSLSVGSPSVEIVRSIPLEHPWIPNCVAEGYEVEEYDSAEADDPTIDETGPQAKITVSFKGLQYPIVGSEAYMRVSARGFLQERAADDVGFSGGGTPIFEVRRLVPGVRYSLAVFDARITPEIEAFWVSNQGSTNVAAFREVPAGQVLFETVDFDYTLKRDGTSSCNYTLNLSALKEPWNQELKGDTLTQVNIGSDPRYPAIDFDTLFR